MLEFLNGIDLRLLERELTRGLAQVVLLRRLGEWQRAGRLLVEPLQVA